MTSRDTVAVSACLIGMRTAYDGKSRLDIDCLKKLKGRPILPVCPEVFGGLAVPRISAEIQADGKSVGNEIGADISANFQLGAEKTLALLAEYSVRKVYLKDGSPSCGHTWIYDGSFSHRRISGEGITCSLLRNRGIEVAD